MQLSRTARLMSMAGLLFATAQFVAGTAGFAATPDQAMAWLSGRWAEAGKCKDGWMRFGRKGQAWTYRELAYEKGKPFPATASADASGVVTVRAMMPGGEYTFVNTFHDKNSFDAVETFTSADTKGEPSSHAYVRCK
jgi:hypothetical protein